MTVEQLVSRVPQELYAKCMDSNPKLTQAAAKGAVNLANSTGWMAIPEQEAVDTFIAACEEYVKQKGM
jgi:hypothetical protein